MDEVASIIAALITSLKLTRNLVTHTISLSLSIRTEHPFMVNPLYAEPVDLVIE